MSAYRKVAEMYLGRKLKKGEVVHHINGNRDDNRIENLLVLKDAETHRNIHHGTKIKRATTLGGRNKKNYGVVIDALSHKRYLREKALIADDIVLYGPNYKSVREQHMKNLAEKTKIALGLK